MERVGSAKRAFEGGRKMSQLRERVYAEIDTLSDAQIDVGLKMIAGLKAFSHVTEKSEDPFYSSKNLKYIENGVRALDNGEGVEHDLIEI